MTFHPQKTRDEARFEGGVKATIIYIHELIKSGYSPEEVSAILWASADYAAQINVTFEVDEVRRGSELARLSKVIKKKALKI